MELKCPYCQSQEIGNYRNTPGRGINWEGKEMFWCKECGKNFTEGKKVEPIHPSELDIGRPQGKPRNSELKEKTKFYLNRKGEKVYY